MPEIKLALQVNQLIGLLTASAPSEGLPNIAEQLSPPLETLIRAVNELASLTNKAVQNLSRAQQFLQEETNMVWWLFGGYSRDLERRMADLELPAACVVAGKELADLTMVSPGPFSAIAFLDAMLLKVEPDLRDQTTLHEAINKVPRDWRNKWIQERYPRDVEDLCPVHLAVRTSLETSGEEDWLPTFETASRIKAMQSIPPRKLALQVFRENLLARAVNTLS